MLPCGESTPCLEKIRHDGFSGRPASGSPARDEVSSSVLSVDTERVPLTLDRCKRAVRSQHLESHGGLQLTVLEHGAGDLAQALALRTGNLGTSANDAIQPLEFHPLGLLAEGMTAEDPQLSLSITPGEILLGIPLRKAGSPHFTERRAQRVACSTAFQDVVAGAVKNRRERGNGTLPLCPFDPLNHRCPTADAGAMGES